MLKKQMKASALLMNLVLRHLEKEIVTQISQTQSYDKSF